MNKKLAAGIVTGLMLGGASVALAQQAPMVVTSYQATADVATAVPLAVGGTFCIDALAFLSNGGLMLRHMHVTQGGSLLFVVTSRSGGSGAIVTCTPFV